MQKGNSIILRIYFAAVALITLITLMFGAIDFLTIGLRKIIPGADRPDWALQDCTNLPSDVTMVKPPNPDGSTTVATNTPEQQKADCERNNTQQLESWRNQQISQMVRNLALIIISLPLFIIHFRVVYKDWKEERK